MGFICSVYNRWANTVCLDEFESMPGFIVVPNALYPFLLLCHSPIWLSNVSKSPYALEFIPPPTRATGKLTLCRCPLRTLPCFPRYHIQMSAFSRFMLGGFLLSWSPMVIGSPSALAEWRSRALWVNEYQCPSVKTNDLIPRRAPGTRRPVGTHLSSA